MTTPHKLFDTRTALTQARQCTQARADFIMRAVEHAETALEAYDMLAIEFDNQRQELIALTGQNKDLDERNEELWDQLQSEMQGRADAEAENAMLRMLIEDYRRSAA